MRTRLLRRLALGPALVATALSGAACGGGAGARPAESASAVPPEALLVTDGTFAREAVMLLGSREGTPERSGRLVGVVRYQLDRAARLFDDGHDEAAARAVEGALYLVRSGEFDPRMTEGRTAPILAAAHGVARSGRAGSALALYSILSRVLPEGSTRTEVRQHLAALEGWLEQTRSRGPIQAAGGDQRTATERALWDPATDTIAAAEQAAVLWVDRVIAYSQEQRAPRDDFERDEAIEAYRAIRIGAMTLAAVHLRNGNARGALAAVEKPSISRVVSAPLNEALRRAADDDEPEAWLELYSQFDRASGSEQEVSLDPALGRAAAWGAAVELYRVEPVTPRGVIPLATLLMRHGMAEVAPLVLEPILSAKPQPEFASWALGYVLSSLVNHDAIGDVAAARRTFTNARPLLESVERAKLGREVTPSPARLRQAMGTLEARAGSLAAAEPLLALAAESEPTLPTLSLLAAIARQRGDAKKALTWLERVARIAADQGDPASVAEAQVQRFQVLRDSGSAPGDELEIGLRRALDARLIARTGSEHSTAERALARVLEQYGLLDAAQRATVRAYEAARNDVRQLTATVLEAARRGLTHGDARAARAALVRALDANLAAEDLVYVALWLRLIERSRGVPSDGTVEEALSKVDDDSGWPARLRSWGSGRLSDEQLIAAARSSAEQTEAAFYAAMGAYAANDTRALDQLASVAKSESIELVEVAIARDIVALRKPSTVKPPPSIEIP